MNLFTVMQSPIYNTPTYERARRTEVFVFLSDSLTDLKRADVHGDGAPLQVHLREVRF